MILEVNALAVFYGNKKRKNFVIEVQDTNENNVKTAIAKNINLPNGLRIDSEELNINEKRKLVLYRYEIKTEEKEHN